MLHRRTEEAEENCAMTKREMEDRVGRIVSQCNSRIESMSKHAREVQEASVAALENVQQEHGAQLSLAHVRAEGRCRFKELCKLSKLRSDKHISQTSYEKSKEDLIELWHMQSRTAMALPKR